MSTHGSGEINPQELFTGKGRYVLEVRGETMVGIGIMDGDFVVIQHQEEARNGEIVVALVDRGEATLKRYYRHASGVRVELHHPDTGISQTADISSLFPEGLVELRPENSNLPTAFYTPDRVEVQGKMVGLFRSY